MGAHFEKDSFCTMNEIVVAGWIAGGQTKDLEQSAEVPKIFNTTNGFRSAGTLIPRRDLQSEPSPTHSRKKSQQWRILTVK
jgi:hypothetical protein